MEILMHTIISRVFRNGHSQAVRIPQELRLNTSRVEISRNDAGDLIIHPIPADRGAALLEALEGFDAEYAELLEDVLAEQPPMQERDEL
jgi:antitoxin VapB